MPHVPGSSVGGPFRKSLHGLQLLVLGSEGCCIVSPDEALHRNAEWPRSQCRIADDLTRTYDARGLAGHMGNSLPHLMLALSASLQLIMPFYASVERSGLMSRALKRTMSILVLSSSPGLAATVKLDRGSEEIPLQPPGGTAWGIWPSSPGTNNPHRTDQAEACRSKTNDSS